MSGMSESGSRVPLPAWPRRATVATTPVLPARVARSTTSAMGAPAAPSALPAPVDQSRIVGTPLPPLGPERYYPNGIAPLRPEFMHQLPAGSQAR
ncbi:hypothetical protein ACPWT1_06735 [Ramlibacter sp. MMS24-I3-19]|uniref:hypothetical protein n=1 Tax=Ramlibacter sp. MMS24-I3-19 TaxID=3416606 RepID=UPI003CFF28C4